MHAQVHIGGRGRRARSTPKSNCLYTPTYTASDREEEVESSDLDLSDYYSDSGFPTLPRPRLVLRKSSRSLSQTQVTRGTSTTAAPLVLVQRKTATLPLNGHKQTDSSHARSRKLSVVSPPTTHSPRETILDTKTKAFNKLRSLKNNRIIPVSSPDRRRPPSSLVTNSICANGNNSPGQTITTSPDGNLWQLRSVSLPEGTSTCDAKMAQVKQKKSKKVSRALSFSFGSGDRKKRARSIFGTFGRGGGEDACSLATSEPPQVKRSPVLVGRRGGGGGTATIYEEDRSSLSSVEDQEERLNSINYLHGNKFGSCRELSSVGCETSDSTDRPQLRMLSKSKHKRPSLPNFTKFLSGNPASKDQNVPSPLREEVDDKVLTGGFSGSTHQQSKDLPSQSPPGSVVSTPSPSRGKFRRRKLSDPGSASSTPEPGSSPILEHREEGGVARGGRSLRKGFTFSVGGANISPEWKEMRHHIVRFLLETEQSYVQSLRTIIKVYFEPLKKPQAFGMIDSSLVKDIFFQIPEICTLHEQFLKQISQRTDRWHPLQKIGDVFVNTFSKCHLMNIYTMFIHNFMRAKAAMEIAKQARPVFAKFLERGKCTTGKLSLDDLLIKPVQRIPRYLLFIKDLLKHTSVSHPDHAPLQQALEELTGLAERVNESEREMARMEKQKELLNSVDGLALFVRPESELVRYDLVTEAQGSAYKRDRFLILFSDVLVCASTRRKSTGLRRSSLLNLNTLNPDSFRYKIKWSSPLKHLSLGEVQAPMVERKKKNTIEKMMENLTRDEATLVQLLETSSTLRQPHQPLTSMLKEMLSEVRGNVAEKKAELENLPLLHSRVDLMCYNSLPPTQYSIIFPSQKIRNSWEEDFLRVKQSMWPPLLDTPTLDSTQLSSEGEFKFLHPLHVQSGRTGMELSCAGVGLPADGDSSHNLWVACCDGYGGQVCLLDLQSSTRPHMVANITVSDSKILCITAVPLSDDTEEPSDDPVGLQDVPLDNFPESLKSGQDAAHPELGNNTTQSMPRDLRGSLVTSFSSDSSSTGTSISRTPSLSSTRSEPRTDTNSPVDPLPGIVGVVSDMLDSAPPTSSRRSGFRGHDDEPTVRSQRKNGFHRVCSNSAPDLLKVIAESSPTEEGYRRKEEIRGATSLSPPPPVDPKFWSPLTLRSPLMHQKEKEERSSTETGGTSMWLGTDGGQILVYSPGSDLRSRSNRHTVQLPAAVQCIRHHKRRVFAGLADGTVAVFDPKQPTAGHTHLIHVSSTPIVSCVSLGDQLLVTSETSLYIINTSIMEARPLLSLPENQMIQFVEDAGQEDGERVWVSVRDKPLLHLYHIPSATILTSVDCSQKLRDVLRGHNPIIRQNKASSLRITSLLLSHQHLLIGTSSGIILTLPLSSHSHLSPASHLSHLPHRHTNSVSFLCELQCCGSPLILSGGTGYGNLTTSSKTTHHITETASCLLLWRPVPPQDNPE